MARLSEPAGFRPDLQGLRAIAVSMVVIYHLYPSALPGGYVGVDVFFVISGFLITGHLLRTMQRSGRVRFIDFYGRRARRLMPASALVLAVTWIASRLILPTSQLADTATQVRASALYFQNWVLAHDAVSYLKSDNAPSPVQHFWSLSVEEQFYLLWPLLFLVAGLVAANVARRRPLRAHEAPGAARALAAKQTMFVLAGIVTVASLAWSIHDTATNPAAAYFVTTTRIWELGVGGLLALLGERAAERIGRFGVLAWVGLALVVTSAFVITGTSAFPGYVAMLPVGGAALLIACGSAGARVGPSWLTSLAPMVFLGDISYSLYLWHWPIIVLWKAHAGHGIGALSGPVIALLSIGLAWLTKVFVEDRVRLASFFAQHQWRSVATVTAAIVPVLLVSVYIADEPPPFNHQLDAKHPGGAVLANPSLAVPKATAVPSPAQAVADEPAYFHGKAGCQTLQPYSKQSICYYGDTTNPTKTIALVGDSVIGQWFSPINRLAKQRHWRLVLDLHSACPWSSTLTRFPGTKHTPYSTCQHWGRTVLHKLLTTIKPDVVITSARPTLGTMTNLAPRAPAFRQIAAGMVDYWRKLIAHRIPVIAVRETPEMGKDIPTCLSRRGATVASCSIPSDVALPPTSPIRDAVALMGSAVPLIDMDPLICAPTVCSAVVGNVEVYRDMHHLTDTYVDSIASYFDSKLLAALGSRWRS